MIKFVWFYYENIGFIEVEEGLVVYKGSVKVIEVSRYWLKWVKF